MAIDSLFLDQIRARVSISSVVGAQVKLQKKGNQLWGCCPFHNEKTPSFTVSDDKEFYHCFGCSEHGDVISFVMKTQGVAFVEAVQQLSAQAGLQMPSISPEDKKKQQQRLSLYEVCETACDFFQKTLYSQMGASALSYIKNRGLSDGDIRYFKLGFSPNSNMFIEYMKSKNIEPQALIDAGLIRQGKSGEYAFFRERLMFPITDTRGRVVAFGGRFMGDEKQAGVGKYVNSPQGILYDKSRVLYNLKNAREPAYKHNRLIVCEGYMDVIALSRAGFTYAVAPCGTAMTEEQILQCWKTVDEPILCFDGDTAGQKAALRTCERALPLLKAGKSVNIAMMPTGKDPDDIIRVSGVDSMKHVLDTAVPLRDFLWQVAVDTHDTSTPERLAKLEKQLNTWAYTIEDKSVSSTYKQNFKDLVWQTFKKQGGRKNNTTRSNAGYLQSLRLDEKQQQTALACLINHPKVFANIEEKFYGFFHPIYDACFKSACNGLHQGIETVEQMHTHLQDTNHQDTLNTVCNDQVYQLARSAHPKTSDEDAQQYIDDIIRLSNMNKIKSHAQTLAQQYAESDQIEKLESLGQDVRLQEQQLYDMDNWD